MSSSSGAQCPLCTPVARKLEQYVPLNVVPVYVGIKSAAHGTHVSVDVTIDLRTADRPVVHDSAAVVQEKRGALAVAMRRRDRIATALVEATHEPRAFVARTAACRRASSRVSTLRARVAQQRYENELLRARNRVRAEAIEERRRAFSAAAQDRLVALDEVRAATDTLDDRVQARQHQLDRFREALQEQLELDARALSDTLLHRNCRAGTADQVPADSAVFLGRVAWFCRVAAARGGVALPFALARRVSLSAAEYTGWHRARAQRVQVPVLYDVASDDPSERAVALLMIRACAAALDRTAPHAAAAALAAVGPALRPSDIEQDIGEWESVEFRVDSALDPVCDAEERLDLHRAEEEEEEATKRRSGPARAAPRAEMSINAGWDFILPPTPSEGND